MIAIIIFASLFKKSEKLIEITRCFSKKAAISVQVNDSAIIFTFTDRQFSDANHHFILIGSEHEAPCLAKQMECQKLIWQIKKLRAKFDSIF